jgi:hypothetical protein
MLREIASVCAELARLDPDFEVDAQATVVRFKSGKTATALPCSDKAVRSWTGFFICDEVAFWRRPEVVWAAAKAASGPTLSEPRGYGMLLVTTPWDAGSLAHRLFTDESFGFTRHSVDIYQAKAAGFPVDIDRVRDELGVPELFDSEFACRWSRGGESFFPAEKLRDCTVDVVEENGIERSGLPEGWQRAKARFGIDCGGGRGRDFTAIVQWRLIGSVWWMVGLKASNIIPTVEMADIAADWMLDTGVVHEAAELEVRADQGIMGLDFIRQLEKRLKNRKRTQIQGVSMSPADQERYAVAGRRLLERGQMKLYAGADAGGDDHGARALSLELSNMKARPGNGGRLTFATPRDPTKGHLDRAWASLIGLDEADQQNERPKQLTSTQLLRLASGGRFGNSPRGFG